ncbi:MAG: hypothetical protein QM484_03325 [Woeseiaceae bacterium]
MLRSNSIPSKQVNKTRARVTSYLIPLIFVATSMMGANAQAADSMDGLKKVMKGQLAIMKPKLRNKVENLSTDTKMSLMSILAMHSRYSEKATLRQVMLEVLADYQTMVMGIMTDSSEMAADSARRLANHRIPVGGLLPYLGLENITDERLAVLDTFNSSVEGNANKLADAAEKGDMAKAASFLGPISTGCVGCHQVFRAYPGQSDLLKIN